MRRVHFRGLIAFFPAVLLLLGAAALVSWAGWVWVVDAPRAHEEAPIHRAGAVVFGLLGVGALVGAWVYWPNRQQD